MSPILPGPVIPGHGRFRPVLSGPGPRFPVRTLVVGVGSGRSCATVTTSTQEWFTVEEVAERCDVSYDKALDWLRAGDINAIKLGRRWRVHPDDLDEFIDRQRRAGRRGKA